jgi:hypothetical protein
VGESQVRIRSAMDVIKAVGRGHAYFVATSNNATSMRPEFQARFTDGMWMFDLMSDEERAAALKHYVAKYELKKSQVNLTAEDIEGWTGREIRNLCRYAWDTGVTLKDASAFIVPVSRSRADEIERLRRYAHGRFLDANKPGTYVYDTEPMVKQLRAIALEAMPVDKQKVN